MAVCTNKISISTGAVFKEAKLVVYIENFSQPSILELARSGDYFALNYWIDSLLRPEGIYARVEAAKSGCLQILVEFQREFAADTLIVNTLRERLVKFLCHQIWRLNSPTVEGVRVIARLAGTSDILWKQSVRIVTPATRYRKRYRSAETLDWIKFKTLRSLLLMSSTVASLLIGCWVSYHEANSWAVQTAEQQALVSAKQLPKRPDTVQAALEVVPVVHHQQVFYPNDPTVTLMFGGDVTLSEELTEITDKDYDWAFSGLEEYLHADLAMINLETSLTNFTDGRSPQQNNFNAANESVKILTAAGVDIVNLAKNHTMDSKESGLVETIENLEKAGIRHLGTGQDAVSARRPQIIEVKGQRIAYLSYNNSEVRITGEQKLDTNSQEKQRVAEDIKAIRDRVDWVIVNFHWGTELSEYPGDWQIDLARFTVKQGADLVVGHHPHILQGAEIYQGRPIVYSLGDFIFGGKAIRSNYDSAVLKVSLKDRLMKVEFLPIEVSKYQPKLVTGEKGKQILKRIEQISSIFDQPMRSPVVLDAPMNNGSKKTLQPIQEGVKERKIQGTLEPLKNSQPTNLEPKNPASSPSLSLPSLPKKSHNSSFFESETTPANKPSPAGNKELPPLLKLNPPKHPSKETDPFIKDPFIKDPFISPPSPKTEETPSPHSYLPPSLTPSFQVIPKEGGEKVMVAGGRVEGDRRKVVKLPFVEVLDFSSV
ncbi:poly-gamma-glutamate biosynthesis protein [Oscillatoriales cyanobacterium USR001]|nr:poly-gamma-glutamate biosynthesis protein [Oscillatoriales cyanobacterium USR001]